MQSCLKKTCFTGLWFSFLKNNQPPIWNHWADFPFHEFFITSTFRYQLRETKAMSVSAKKHDFGRQNAYSQDEQEYGYSSEYMNYTNAYQRANQQFQDFTIDEEE